MFGTIGEQVVDREVWKAIGLSRLGLATQADRRFREAAEACEAPEPMLEVGAVALRHGAAAAADQAFRAALSLIPGAFAVRMAGAGGDQAADAALRDALALAFANRPAEAEAAFERAILACRRPYAACKAACFILAWQRIRAPRQDSWLRLAECGFARAAAVAAWPELAVAVSRLAAVWGLGAGTAGRRAERGTTRRVPAATRALEVLGRSPHVPRRAFAT